MVNVIESRDKLMQLLYAEKHLTINQIINLTPPEMAKYITEENKKDAITYVNAYHELMRSTGLFFPSLNQKDIKLSHNTVKRILKGFNINMEQLLTGDKQYKQNVMDDILENSSEYSYCAYSEDYTGEFTVYSNPIF